MTDRTAEPGFELVLDNRKLIIAFAAFIAICGCFFVLGFVEGKRQGLQEGSRAAAESAKPNPSEAEAQASKPAGADSAAKPKEGSEEQQLDWYKNVSRRESEPGIVPQTASDSAPKPAAPSAAYDKPKPQANAARSEPVSYSVQVGAFRQRKELDLRAQMLRSKGYDCRIEAPHPPEQLYLLKVGKFNSRAEAYAMQLRLRKSGFASAFIKTN
jgi:cell division protein FtsN